ncbi:PhoPQ-activated protein PqaA family protein [Kosakonia sp. SMBL-WEM22]|uniref:PhoPQ-activated protein PqaA family protein n=1 Tax=Kosakonia sp. SMBL-WEM22 TaxID=2725560 RepID=UPI001CB88FF8|nr:PhoPQ-activated protein PqaA family protein [Kosakonia sp. SMBL-WEM22]
MKIATYLFFIVSLAAPLPSLRADTLTDYRQSLAAHPVNYVRLDTRELPGVKVQRYVLHSQNWSPQDAVRPIRWEHQVDIYLPAAAKSTAALMVVNNDAGRATSFNEASLARIALATHTVVVSVSNVPNQPLHYRGNSSPLTEDDSVAYSWKRYLESGDAPLQIPMSASVSQAFRLVKRELSQQKIAKFIVTGASKRGWAAWLAAISDPDVVAVVPFAVDLLNTRAALDHIYRSYGNNWPAAFYPYYRQQIDQQIGTDNFARLMRVLDPMAYLRSKAGERLKIKKYVINASGDDFYTPDNSRFYYPRLPGEKALRVVANASHEAILSVAEPSLIAFVNRFQARKALPTMVERRQGKHNLMIHFSGLPEKVIIWRANNPLARDFRYACGVRYEAFLPPAMSGNGLNVMLTTPETGWQATFVEATFSDGFVATSQVYITPDEIYPDAAPSAQGGACRTLPGRGLTPKTQKAN